MDKLSNGKSPAKRLVVQPRVEHLQRLLGLVHRYHMPGTRDLDVLPSRQHRNMTRRQNSNAKERIMDHGETHSERSVIFVQPSLLAVDMPVIELSGVVSFFTCPLKSFQPHLIPDVIA